MLSRGNGEDDCPRCQAYGDAIIGVEIRGLYDGVLYWLCINCQNKFHRFAPGTHQYDKAKKFVEDNSKFNF